jgi:hypothetical protein
MNGDPGDHAALQHVMGERKVFLPIGISHSSIVERRLLSGIVNRIWLGISVASCRVLDVKNGDKLGPLMFQGSWAIL